MAQGTGHRRPALDGIDAEALAQHLHHPNRRALDMASDARTALTFYNRAIAIHERLVGEEGQRELRGDLDWTYAAEAGALLELGERDKTRRLGRRAVAILDGEVHRTGRADLQGVLEWARNALKEML